MKLTSFRLKDQVHLKNMLNAGVITVAVEEALPSELRQRLEQVTAAD